MLDVFPLTFVDPSGHQYENMEGGCIDGGEEECPEIISEGSKADDWYNNGGKQEFEDANNPNLQEMPDPSDPAYFQWTWDMMAWCMRNGCDEQLTTAYFEEVRAFLLMGYVPQGYWSRNEFSGLHSRMLEDDRFNEMLAYVWAQSIGSFISYHSGTQGFIRGGGGLPCSFSADTLVETEDGPVPIAMLEEGTYVLAYDEETGEIGYYPILVVWAHEDPVIVYLTIDAESIITTPEHPFYTTTFGWVEAGDLQVGDQILKSVGSYGQVQQVDIVARRQIMYDLTVANVHTFFVGQNEWLVHNCPSGGSQSNPPPRLTSAQQETLANNLGYQRTNYRSHGQPVFRNGNRYISYDWDSHSGGTWKMANSVRGLGSRNTRLGTYNSDLSVRIGD